MDAVRERAIAWRHHDAASSVMLLYRIADALVDSYFPVMARFDDTIDQLEEAILKSPDDAQIGALFAMKRQLISLRKLITPERDLMASLVAGSDLPGMTDDAARYFRDLYDHLIRLSDLVDSYRDLLTSAVDTHLSTVSNRLNEVMKQLAIIATIFLPLSFLTGFFGQNFAWLVGRIGGFWVFLLVGIGSELAAIFLLLRMFRRRGWL
jgi:magnesium transporter